MRPGPGLVVMALAFISGAWRGSTSTSQQKKSSASLSASTSSPFTSSLSSSKTSILFSSPFITTGGASSSSSIVPPSSSSSTQTPPTPPPSPPPSPLSNDYHFYYKSPPQQYLLPEQLRHHHEPRRKIPQPPPPPTPPTPPPSLSKPPSSPAPTPPPQTLILPRETREAKVKTREVVVVTKEVDDSGVSDAEIHLHLSSSLPSSSSSSSSSLSSASASASVQYLSQNSDTNPPADEDDFFPEDNLISDETEIGDTSNFEQLQFDKFRYTNIDDYGGSSSSSDTRSIGEIVNVNSGIRREESGSIVANTLENLFSDSDSITNLNENYQNFDIQNFEDIPVFQSSSSLIRLNPWISACDLAQPNSAPDLQGQCSAGTLPVAWVDEGPGPPTCPKSCQQLKLEDNINKQNNFIKSYSSNSDSNNNNNNRNNNNNNNNMKSVTINNNSNMPLKIRRNAAAAMLKVISSRPSPTKISELTAAKVDSSAAPTSSKTKELWSDGEREESVGNKRNLLVTSLWVDYNHTTNTISDLQNKNNKNNNQSNNSNSNDNDNANDNIVKNKLNNRIKLNKINNYDKQSGYSYLSREKSQTIYSNSSSSSRSSRSNSNKISNKNSSKQQPRIQKQQEQQCLDYLGDNDESSPTQLCKIKSPSELANKLRSLRLKHCCERTVFSALHTIAMNKTVTGGQTCVKILTDIADLDSLATRITCELAEILFRYDCRQIYSLIHQCKDCKEAYRRWVCSTLIPFFGEESSPSESSSSNAKTTMATTLTNSSKNTVKINEKQKRENSNINNINNYNRDIDKNQNNENIKPTSRGATDADKLSTSVAENFSSVVKLVGDHTDRHQSINPKCDYSDRYSHNKSLQSEINAEFTSIVNSEDRCVQDRAISRLLKRTKRKVEFRKRRRIRPCLSVCQTVEQKCPYLLPGDRAPAYPTQYAGEPTFLCLDLHIPETGEQLHKSNNGPPNCCYRYCGRPEQGVCTFCDDFHGAKRVSTELANSDLNNNNNNINTSITTNLSDISRFHNLNMDLAADIGPTILPALTTTSNITTIASIEDLNQLRYYTQIDGTYYYDDIDELPMEAITECQPVPSVTSRCTIPYYASSATTSTSYINLPRYILIAILWFLYCSINSSCFYLNIIEMFSQRGRRRRRRRPHVKSRSRKQQHSFFSIKTYYDKYYFYFNVIQSREFHRQNTIL